MGWSFWPRGSKVGALPELKGARSAKSRRAARVEKQEQRKSDSVGLVKSR